MQPLPHPELVVLNSDAAILLRLDGADDVTVPSLANVEGLAGNRPIWGHTPYVAVNYAGTQFGIYAEQLGDGRCVGVFVYMCGGDEWILCRYITCVTHDSLPFIWGGWGSAAVCVCVCVYIGFV